MFGDRVKYWIIIYNLYLVVWYGYGIGIYVFGEKGNLVVVYVVGYNLIKVLYSWFYIIVLEYKE